MPRKRRARGAVSRRLIGGSLDSNYSDVRASEIADPRFAISGKWGDKGSWRGGSRSMGKQFSPPWFILETGSPYVTLVGLEFTDPPASVSLSS